MRPPTAISSQAGFDITMEEPANTAESATTQLWQVRFERGVRSERSRCLFWLSWSFLGALSADCIVMSFITRVRARASWTSVMDFGRPDRNGRGIDLGRKQALSQEGIRNA